MSTLSPQVRMANDIAAQFAHQDAEAAAAAIAAHIRSFWTPRMRADFLHHAESEPGSLDPLALAAARLLADASA